MLFSEVEPGVAEEAVIGYYPESGAEQVGAISPECGEISLEFVVLSLGL